MTNQIISLTQFINSQTDFLLVVDAQQPIQFYAIDLGYEISEADLGDFLSEPDPDVQLDPVASQVSSEQFESAYSWFIS